MKKVIAWREVISRPGAAIYCERIHLTPAAEQGLVTGAPALPGPPVRTFDDEYRRFQKWGYTGFILRYRADHAGDDPPASLMDDLIYRYYRPIRWHLRRIWRAMFRA